MKELIAEKFKALQNDICSQLEMADGKGQFQEDAWERPGGGGGRSRVIEGQYIEKGGVNFSEVYGILPPSLAKPMKMEPDSPFFATGVSIVLHPANPLAPIIHMNVRYFEAGNGKYWFGGGIDLTPHYVDKSHAKYFHEQMRNTCDRFSPEFYPKFKKQADDYFYIKHRKETRGVGGIFYDYLDEKNTGLSQAKLLDFDLAVGNTFAPTYVHILNQTKNLPYTEEQKRWQMLRRGRYVEFNLVWDKGTKFGLETDGRTESILMSLPPTAQWAYAHEPEVGSAEAETLALLKKDINWLDIV